MPVPKEKIVVIIASDGREDPVVLKMPRSEYVEMVAETILQGVKASM